MDPDAGIIGKFILNKDKVNEQQNSATGLASPSLSLPDHPSIEATRQSIRSQC